MIKRNILRRAVSIMLVLALAVSLLPQAAFAAWNENRYLRLYDRFGAVLSVVNYEANIPINDDSDNQWIYIPIMKPFKLDWKMQHTQCVKFSLFTYDGGVANGIGDFIGSALVYEKDEYEAYLDVLEQYFIELDAYYMGELDDEPVEPDKPEPLPIPDNADPDAHTVVYDGETDLTVYWEGFIIDTDGVERMVGEYADGVYQPVDEKYILALDSHDYKDGETGIPSRLPLLIHVDWTEATMNALIDQYGEDELAKYMQEYLRYILDPVDITNGNFTWEYTDFALYGAQSLEFTRKYNSLDGVSSILGTGWRHNYGYSIIEGAYASTFVMANGYKVSFICGRDGVFTAPRGSDYTLEKAPAGFKVVLPKG